MKNFILITINMKNFILMALMCFAVTQVFSQEKMGTYSQAYADKSFDVSISGDSTKFSLWVDMYSMDATTKSGGVKLDNKNIDSFTKLLNDAKLKYSEWTAVAKENNVTELSKDMVFTSKVSGFFSYGKWQFDYTVTLTSRFKIVNNKYLLIIDTGEMISSSNEFMKTDGFSFVFSNVNEIDNLLSLVSNSEIKSYFRKSLGQANKFKD